MNPTQSSIPQDLSQQQQQTPQRTDQLMQQQQQHHHHHHHRHHQQHNHPSDSAQDESMHLDFRNTSQSSNTSMRGGQFAQGFTLPSYDGSGPTSSAMDSSTYGASSLLTSTMTGNQAFGTSGTTGLESLESLASLSVMSPTLPMPSSMTASTGRRNSTGASGGSSSYFSPSFQPVQSLPVIYQNQATTSFGQSSNGLGNNNSNNGGTGGSSASFLPSQNQGQSQDMFSSFQGSKAQQYQHHRQQVPSFPLSSSLSSSLPAHSDFHHYSLQQQTHNRHYLQQQQQQQQPSHLHSQDLSQSHSSSQSSSSIPSFPREARGRSRSASITGVSIASTSTDTTTPTTMSFGNTNARDNTAASPQSTNPVLNKIKVPDRPRAIPPRPPQASAPRKYHGRQVRKAPIPSIDHHQVSGLSGLAPPARRLAHIMSEQKRREKINAGFEELKTVIPE
ncbi:hypothetical protein BG011_004244 [Mortierella polycephala]|uniref:BHLH domain-containing protein n=1 Tax=Mortierella polycephala TaxID=41804 RepID=A0A9P6Q279_9FUNG|nr:hypothetical protein BG011_004244 [Mortierella polycephala]